ncbi:hypothetical protein SARC_08508 [Sphaeroforma arctica JP610]|uniref:Uncharacterized protein n=1 Tax=Sphaeroforma arctica JP610 TaxID=667725 RepID=A0A0L0FRC8_9EUKA|nr:hypothetical protein SARC_08508 [Sphaeroforma arctica JP610]KNC79086.1 hypothetical protein SARC_08508 [Sphaeroforma arctica JP610]|eukprot:XP_014152988.1 hypothetical protein SARC_08508 [Sphaeroforma arctica JP610]
MFQERAYQEHSCEKYKKKIYEAQQYMHDMKTKYTSELQGYKLKLEEVQNKVVEMEGTLHQKEAQVNDLTRRFRNQQYMFNELKMKSNNLSATSLSRKDKENAPDLGAGPTTRPSQPLPQAMPGTPMQLMSARGNSLPASQVNNLNNKARMQSFAITPAAPNLPSRPQTPSLGRALAARREQKKTNSMT